MSYPFKNMSSSPFKSALTIAKAETCGVRIYMAGDYDTARAVLRKHCSMEGACFSIQRADYIYSGGEEAGFVVNMINYPRFPSNISRIFALAATIGHKLMEELGQGSYTLEEYGTTHAESRYVSRRKGES